MILLSMEEISSRRVSSRKSRSNPFSINSRNSWTSETATVIVNYPRREKNTSMKVYKVLLPSQFLPKFTGAAPFGISKRKISFSKFGQVWSFVNSSMAIAIMWLNWSKAPSNINGMADILNTITFWLQFSLANLSVLKDGVCQQGLIDIARSIDDFDEKTGYDDDTSVRLENERIRLWSFVYSIALVAFAVIRLAIFYILPAAKNPLMKFANEHALLMIDNSICMFAVFATLLGMRFRYLNSIIERESPITVRNSCFASASNPEHIRSLYSSLVATGEKLNDHYSSRLFFWSARTMIETITRVYNITYEETTAMTLMRTVARLFSFVVGLLVVTISCDFTVNQANKIPTALLAKNIRRTDQIDRGRKEIFTMCLYMTLRPFAFSALGFFNVDLTLTYAAFSVSVTYIALCMQTRGG